MATSDCITWKPDIDIFQTLASSAIFTVGEAKVDKEVEAKANEILKAEFAEKLLPYPLTHWSVDGDKNSYLFTFCPKCGREMRHVTLYADTDRHPEHLMWECNCSYTMFTKTKDAE